MNTIPTIPPNSWDTVLFLLKKLDKENTAIKEDMAGIGAALIRVETELSTLSKGVNSRLKRLEEWEHDDLKTRADASSKINTAEQRVLHSQESKDGGFPKDLLIKIAPWILMAALFGASIGGFMMAKSETESTGITKAEILELIKKTSKP